MHLPELPLGAGSLSSFSRMLCLGMRGTDGEMPVDKGDAIPKPLLQFLDDRMRLQTMRTLIIAVLNEYDRSVESPPHMITFANLLLDSSSRPLGSYRSFPLPVECLAALQESRPRPG